MKSIEDLKSKLAYYEDQLKKYHEFFMQDGKIEPNEQAQLDEMQGWINGIKDALKKKGLLETSDKAMETSGARKDSGDKNSPDNRKSTAIKVSKDGMAVERTYTLLQKDDFIPKNISWGPFYGFKIAPKATIALKVSPSFQKSFKPEQTLTGEVKITTEGKLELVISDMLNLVEGSVAGSLAIDSKTGAKLHNPGNINNEQAFLQNLELGLINLSVALKAEVAFRPSKTIENLIRSIPKYAAVPLEYKLSLGECELFVLYIASYKKGTFGSFDYGMGKGLKAIGAAITNSKEYQTLISIANAVKAAAEATADAILDSTDVIYNIASKAYDYFKAKLSSIVTWVSKTEALKHEIYQQACKVALRKQLEMNMAHFFNMEQLSPEGRIKYINQHLMPRIVKMDFVEKIYREAFGKDQAVNLEQAKNSLNQFDAKVTIATTFDEPLQLNKVFKFSVKIYSTKAFSARGDELKIRLKCNGKDYFANTYLRNFAIKEKEETILSFEEEITEAKIKEMLGECDVMSLAWVLSATLELEGVLNDCSHHQNLQLSKQ